MDQTPSERHVAELRQTLRDLVAEAEKRVANLEAELVEARTVLTRMRNDVEPRLRALGTPYGADLRRRLAAVQTSPSR